MENDSPRVKVFTNATWMTVIAAAGAILLFGPTWGLVPVILFVVFTIMY